MLYSLFLPYKYLSICLLASQVLEQASERVFVPLTVGGGIRAYKDASGREWSALEVVGRYFRAGGALLVFVATI